MSSALLNVGFSSVMSAQLYDACQREFALIFVFMMHDCMTCVSKLENTCSRLN
jgi:hypothetical protein